MNIGVDIRALGIKRLTGIGKYILHALDNILELDKENKYYLFSSGLSYNFDEAIDFKADNVEHVHWPISNKLLNFQLLSGLSQQLDKHFPEKLDLFWLPNINFLCLSKDLPLVLTVHDLSFLHSREFYSFKRRYWHRLVNVKKLINRADKVIAVSENTKRDIARFFPLAKDKVEIINPGIDALEMNEEYAKLITADLNLPAKYFIYVGTLEPRKNIDSIVKAFDLYHKDHTDVSLLVVGGKGWVYRNLLKKISRRKYVRYLDYVDGAQKDALYFLSKGLVWPSFYEGFGFPPMEALFHKIPVIVSYKTSLPETIKQQGLYVDPYNVADIYQALKLLTEDDKLIKQFKASAEHFEVPQWPQQAKQMVKLFKSIKK